MNAAEYKALQINKIIKTSSEYKEYTKLKESIFGKYEIQESELLKLQQDLVTLAYENEEEFEINKDIYIEKKQEFVKDPLVKRFVEAYNDLQNLLNGVKGIIESGVKQ